MYSNRIGPLDGTFNVWPSHTHMTPGTIIIWLIISVAREKENLRRHWTQASLIVDIKTSYYCNSDRLGEGLKVRTFSFHVCKIVRL